MAKTVNPPPPPLLPVEPRPIHFRLSVDIVIRRCEQADLAALEWFGEFTPHREIIERVFAAQGRGEQVMLMAAFDEAPLGQVWIDLKRKRAESTAVVWALRVFHWFHGRGIGTRLLRAAEKVVTAIGWSCVEIGVEHANTRALALYQRQGYKRAGEHREVQRYRTPDGEQHEVTIDVIALKKRLRAPGKTRVAQRAVRAGR